MYTGIKNNTKYLYKNIDGKKDSHGMLFASYVTPKCRISCAKGSKDRMIYEKFAQLDNKKVYKKWKKQVAKNREYNCGGKYNSSDELLILSTCEYSKENGRFAILCKQVKCRKNK